MLSLSSPTFEDGSSTFPQNVSNVLLDYTAEDSIFILFYMLKYNSP
jgi:hypothetical protein